MLTKDELPACPVATTIRLIGNKWKIFFYSTYLIVLMDLENYIALLKESVGKFLGTFSYSPHFASLRTSSTKTSPVWCSPYGGCQF